MRTFLSHAPGGPETLVLTDQPTPSPGAGDVRVAVEAAAVNFPDTLIIRDKYQVKPPRPFAPGGEVAGRIDAVGDGVTGLAAGDRVLAMPGHGGYATHTLCPAGTVFKIPDTMPFEDAACLMLTYATTHYALKDRADIQAGDVVLVLGAAGGIGVSAIELAKAFEARVIAAVSSQEKANFAKSLGANETVIYPREMDRDAQKAFSATVKELAGPEGVDIVFDAVGGDYAEPALRTLGWCGRFLVIGFPAGIPSIPLNLTLLKSCQIVGVFWGKFTQREPERHARYVRELFDLHAAGKIKPRISRRYPLAEAVDAMRAIENRSATGKLILTMDQSESG